jgi:Holliday junction DNA helicase RuvB
MLPNPLRDRFGYTANLEFYGHEDLATVLVRAAKQLTLSAETEAIELIASRSRGTPRVANRLLRRVRDFALVDGAGVITAGVAKKALELYEVDSLGLDRLDKQILEALIVKFQGKPVGLSTLAVAIGEEPDTIESVVEPYLLREGLIQRTSKGRQATSLAYRHLGASEFS